MHTLTKFLVAALALTAGYLPAQAADDSTSMRIVRLDPALDAVIAPGTQIVRVATGFRFTEGPMWRAGRLWFSDLADDKVLAVAPDGKVEVLIAHAGGLPNFKPGTYLGSNALATDKDGSVLLVQQGGRKIMRLDKQLKPTPYLATYEGKKLNSPNDLVFARDGALWFTDPPFGLPDMDKDSAKEIKFNGVYRYAGGKLTAVITDLTLPNGIGFSPDGKTLYVSNYGPSRYVRAYDVGPNGSVSNGRMLIEYGANETGKGGPDGLKVDTAGNIWMTGPGGVRIVTPQGKVLGQIVLPEVAANIGFADGGRYAYLTASTSIYRLRAATPGMMPLYQQ